MTSASAVVLDGVTKRYGEAVAALRGVTLDVSTGEFVSVVGRSAAGKTTLLHLVAGFDRVSSGHIEVLGRNLSDLSDDALSDLRLRSIGFVFQSFNLFPTLTALENVAWPTRFLGSSRRVASARAAVVLERLGIPVAGHGRFPGELSSGEQQRVAIARALVTEPRLLLADEPTGNLDSSTSRQILTLLTRLNAECGVTIVLVTHDKVAALAGHRTIELRDGHVVGDASHPMRIRAVERCR